MALLEVLSPLSDCVAGQILCKRTLRDGLIQLCEMLIIVLAGFQPNEFRRDNQKETVEISFLMAALPKQIQHPAYHLRELGELPWEIAETGDVWEQYIRIRPVEYLRFQLRAQLRCIRSKLGLSFKWLIV